MRELADKRKVRVVGVDRDTLREWWWAVIGQVSHDAKRLRIPPGYPELKYILLITAVEALIRDERPLKDSAVVDLLDLLRGQAKTADGFNRRVRNRVAGILKSERVETITEVGKALAGKLDQNYDGRSPQDFFELCYSGRSALVHGSTDPEKRPTPREVQRRIPHLQQFVLDLLAMECAEAQED
jgi:hypothetical protein